MFSDISGPTTELTGKVAAQRKGASQKANLIKPLSMVTFPSMVLVFLFPWLIDIPNRLDAVLLGVLVVICAVGVVRSFVDGARPLRLVFFPFTFAWLTVGPIYQLSHGRFAWGDVSLFAAETTISSAVLYTLIAVIAFSVGYAWMDRRCPQVPNGGKINETKDDAKIGTKTWVIWTLIIAGLALAPFALNASGGLSGMFASRAERGVALSQSGLTMAEVGGFRYALGKQLPIAVSIAAACLSVIRARRKIKLSGFSSLRGNELFALIISFGLILLYCNPSANSRYIAVIAFGSLALYIFQPRGRLGGFVFAAVSIFGTLVIYPLLDVFRRGFEGTATLKSGTESFASVDFDGFQQVANSLLFVGEQGHTFGRYTLSALLYFLPRSLWEGKATPASIDVATFRGYSFTDLSLPFHAEMFVEFGVVGMVLAMMAFGAFACRADSSWLWMASTKLGLAAPLIAVALLGFLRGPLGSLAPIYMTAVGLFLLGLERTVSDQEKIDTTRLGQSKAEQ